MIVNVPLHPISVKIILSSHTSDEHNVISVNRRDYLFNFIALYYKKDKSYQKYVSLLTSRLSFDLPSKFTVHDQLLQSGYFIYAMHKRQWLQFIQSRVTYGQKAKPALLDFADMHNIDVNDIDYDNVYRSWTRYKSSLKNTALQLKKSTAYVLEAAIIERQYTEREITSIAQLLVSMHLERFLYSNNQLDKDTYKQLVVYLMYTYQSKTLQQIAEIYKCSHQNISQMIHRFRAKIYQDTPLLRDIEQLAA